MLTGASPADNWELPDVRVAGIPESDISVLIPTYRYRDKIKRALSSALESGAGEIIVVDDASHDGTMDEIAAISDHRLKVLENAENLGLWENHLHALSYATKPWIKFLQADDYLLPGGLAAYAAAVEPGVSVVWAAPTVIDEETMEVSYFHALRAPRKLQPRQLQIGCIYAGWILGSPSHFMVRSDVLVRDEAAWHTFISADLVVGLIAASSGDTVLLPHGYLGQGAHAKQDARTQGPAKGLQRMVNSVTYLRSRTEPGLQDFASQWAIINLPSVIRNMLASLWKRDGSPGAVCVPVMRLIANQVLGRSSRLVRDRALLRSARTFRRESPAVVDLDKLFACQLPGSALTTDTVE